MNRDEAKYLLRACRPGGQDAGDPQFREAAELLQHDPVLSAWFAQEQALDAKLSAAFASFPVPPDLKGQLLAARKVVAPPVWRRWPLRLAAAAACAAVLAGFAAVWLRSPRPSESSDFRVYASALVANLSRLDLQSRDVAQVKQWLQNHGAPADFKLPAGLCSRPSLGCRVFEWNGQKVSLVCFRLDTGEVVHLFVTGRSLAPGSPAGEEPRFALMNDGIAVASWSDDQNTYVLAGHKCEGRLRRLL